MTNPIPQTGIIPHLVVNDAHAAIEFYKQAFGAELICQMPTPDGAKLMHSELRIGDAVVYVCDDFPEMCGGKERAATALGGTPVTVHRYVKDCDAAIKQAEGAGATVTMPADDMFWGDRYGNVTDPFGHAWSFATHIRDMTPEEMEQAAAGAFA